MRLLLPILAWAFVSQSSVVIVTPIDVDAAKVGPPKLVAELDLGKMKGDLRQVGWSPDGTQLYVRSVEGNPPNEKRHHFVVARDIGAVQSVEDEPDWADEYWRFKSDRSAPGVPTLMIDVTRGKEFVKAGPGSGYPGGRAWAGQAGDAATTNDVAMGSEGLNSAVVKFVLLDRTVSEFVNERPIPGLMFSWGPSGTGTIVYTDRDGHLMFLNGVKQHRTVAGVKDASLPAWSTDGQRLAYVVKDGRKKYKLVWCTITQ
jgi:hypothetical protein